MTPIRRLAATVLLAALAAPVSAQQAPVEGQARTPADIYGELFRAVQLGRVFPDGKTFVDAVPKRPVDAILADYRRERPAGDALRRFVVANFFVPGVNDQGLTPLRAHIRQLWPVLTRPPVEPRAGGSALALPRSSIVPGGRFREIYYWDSFFTMLGLKADGQDALVEAMLDDFTGLIERYGHIPNGTRTYYLSRSQPPFYALMLDLSADRDPAVAARRLAALRREHAFWMRGASCLDRTGACGRVVGMPDGSLLNRYHDDRDTPRDESYAGDVATAHEASRPEAETWRNLRAGAESGWDFSSRWFGDGRTLATIRTTDIVPIDLNSLMYAMERRIADRCRAVADRRCVGEFTYRADLRKSAIDRYLWVAGEGRYADWDRVARRPTPVLSAATLYPLFVGAASAEQARAVAGTTRARLLAPGGLRTTTVATGQQWDRPNGWAPLQWVAIDGLERNGRRDLARDIARRWVETVDRVYLETGKLLEKYDVEEARPGGGGEYPTQDGFGWTNGVVSALLERYSDLTPRPAAGDAAPR